MQYVEFLDLFYHLSINWFSCFIVNTVLAHIHRNSFCSCYKICIKFPIYCFIYYSRFFLSITHFFLVACRRGPALTPWPPSVIAWPRSLIPWSGPAFCLETRAPVSLRPRALVSLQPRPAFCLEPRAPVSLQPRAPTPLPPRHEVSRSCT
jgi:hypothetical protein